MKTTLKEFTEDEISILALTRKLQRQTNNLRLFIRAEVSYDLLRHASDELFHTVHDIRTVLSKEPPKEVVR